MTFAAHDGQHDNSCVNKWNYSIRFKQPELCGSGIQHSGYVDRHDTGDHYFFWFFESERRPLEDPTLLWLSGGPGCSSMAGALTEVGPCRLTDDGTATMKNPYTWTKEANVLFLDQPIGTGYSYGKSKVSTSESAAHHVYEFLQIFFKEFNQYANAPLYIGSESYGGHYVPALASEILKYKRRQCSNHISLRFEGMLIGNPLTNPRLQVEYYQEYGCANDTTYHPLFDAATCQMMKARFSQCRYLMDICYKYTFAPMCIPAGLHCKHTQFDPVEQIGSNPYDIRMRCNSTDLYDCYQWLNYLELWANTELVRDDLGIDPQFERFRSCNTAVEERFMLSADMLYDFSSHVAECLKEDVRVLIYAGDTDFVCNWRGIKAWTLEMDWPGKRGYNEASDEDWYSSGKLVGQLRSHGNLAFLKVYEAGHFVPFDRPDVALDYFSRWLNRLLHF
ncbi:hypothetical protein EC973_009406 [Apophysomyces ossiformis]|uniref:Carboxypeptidase n=1 Tax=Apophysomyces ossiformis TaxID=679940 RepID=A0A8H7BME3_9FUNG|nr:hypothetical protein EC973_009406 [Apophysomyces ossiformis]